MSVSIVRYHLKQETPMWHFQSRSYGGHQNGATLRGSDVKPRLDKFLINQMKNNGIDWEKFKLSDNHDALNYKMQLIALGECKHDVNMGSKAFFANMGPNIDPLQTVYYPDGINIKVTCFIPLLMDEITKHLPYFFLINNFGTRQDKGFGSFIVDQKNGEKFNIDILKGLNKYGLTEGYTAYEIDLSKCSDQDHVLDNAYTLYQWMKSGINFGRTYKRSLLTIYMLGKEIQGEKSWMKEKGIAPKVCCTDRRSRTIIKDTRSKDSFHNDSRYIRSVLGVSGNQTWFTDNLKGEDRRGNPKYQKVTVNVSSSEIARFKSPITIKYINHKLFFLAYDLNTDLFRSIFNKEFTFECNRKYGKLNTPMAFDMEDFIDFCSEKCAPNGISDSFIINNQNYGFRIKKITTKGGEK